MATLTVTRTIDFRGDPAETNIDQLVFAGAGATATFAREQFGPGLISTALAITGRASPDHVRIVGSFSALGFNFEDWSADDRVTLIGTPGVYNDIVGSSVADTIVGSGSLNGAGGDDWLRGRDGSDRLIGRNGADTMEGGAGSDTYVDPELADGDVLIEEIGAAGTDTVHAQSDFSLRSLRGIENLFLFGGQNGTGNSADNVLFGNTERNRLEGLDGNDRLLGGQRADTLHGGSGDDTLEGGVDNDRLGAGAGNDRLFGERGDDTLVGGTGNDTIDGGLGADLFVFGAAQGGADRINGFETAIDRFDLSGGAFTAHREANGNTFLTHAGGTILIAGVAGLSLEQWNALVVSEGGAATISEPAFRAGLFERFVAADYPLP